MKFNDAVDLDDVMELMLDAVCVVNISGNFVYVSAAFEKIFGYMAEEVIGKSASAFILEADIEKTTQTVAELLAGVNQPSFENRWIHKSGRTVHVLWSASWSEQHQVRIAVAHDITERKKMEAQLQHLASHDPLTNLPNRSLIKEILKKSLSTAKRNKSNLCLLFIDIDHFKQINDTFGHVVGDRLLQTVAQRLRNCCRDSDFVGRLSGDEFIVIIENAGLRENTASLTEKLCAGIEKPVWVNEHQLQLSISIGIALYPDDATSEEQLIELADQAMYKVKEERHNKSSSC